MYPLSTPSIGRTDFYVNRLHGQVLNRGVDRIADWRGLVKMPLQRGFYGLPHRGQLADGISFFSAAIGLSQQYSQQIEEQSFCCFFKKMIPKKLTHQKYCF